MAKVKALSFDGVDDYVYVGDSPELSGMAELTIESIVYLPDAPVGYKPIISKWDDATNDYSYWLGFYYRRVHVQVYGVADEIVRTVADVDIGKWMHIVATWDGSDLRIFIDGIEHDVVKTKDGSGSVKRTTYPVRVARYQTKYLQAYIALVRVYNRALSDAEILYNKEHPYNPVTHGLVLWLAHDTVDEAAGVWRDKSGQGNHGTIYGATTIEMNKLAGRVLAPAR